MAATYLLSELAAERPDRQIPEIHPAPQRLHIICIIVDKVFRINITIALFIPTAGLLVPHNHAFTKTKHRPTCNCNTTIHLRCISSHSSNSKNKLFFFHRCWQIQIQLQCLQDCSSTAIASNGITSELPCSSVPSSSTPAE